MLDCLFAARTTWIGALIVVVAGFLLWFFFRALVDLANWFNEEILEDYRERKRKKDEDLKS